MAKFTYIGDEERVYPNIVVAGAVLVAEPGTVYDLDADPADGRWNVVSSTKASAPVTAPASDAPAAPTN